MTARLRALTYQPRKFFLDRHSGHEIAGVNDFMFPVGSSEACACKRGIWVNITLGHIHTQISDRLRDTGAFLEHFTLVNNDHAT